MINKYVFAECHAEVKFARLLGIKKNYINHCDGKGEVVNALLKQVNINKVVVGLVDEDLHVTPPLVLGKFTREERDNFSEYKIQYSVCKMEAPKYLIVLVPKFETWIYWVADKYGLNKGKRGVTEKDILKYKLTGESKTSQETKVVALLKALVEMNPEPIKIYKELLHKIVKEALSQ